MPVHHVDVKAYPARKGSVHFFEQVFLRGKALLKMRHLFQKQTIGDFVRLKVGVIAVVHQTLFKSEMLLQKHGDVIEGNGDGRLLAALVQNAQSVDRFKHALVLVVDLIVISFADVFPKDQGHAALIFKNPGAQNAIARF